VRKAAGLANVRFHDGRHTITTLAEKGQPDWVIQSQVGHVAPEMMKTYSHIRRQALNQAADALEPLFSVTPPSPPTPDTITKRAGQPRGVWSHSRSQHAGGRGRIVRFAREIGSSGWIRTSNPPVNSRIKRR
jgi:Phage integrase family